VLTRDGKPVRILIVEDHALIALDLQLMIDELKGNVVGTTARGEEVIDLVAKLHPDVVLMDVRLAGITDGVDAARAVARFPDTRLIFVTGNVDPLTLRRIRRAGDYRIVSKPVLPSDLLEAISDTLDLDGGIKACAATVWQISALPRRHRSERAETRHSAPATPPASIEDSPTAVLIDWRQTLLRSRALFASLQAQCRALEETRRRAALAIASSRAARAARITMRERGGYASG
jgi:DNA-binding NarL/FixJ family response regulator